MKKTLSVILVAVLIMAMAACFTGCKDQNSGTAGMANPVTEYESLAEINKIVGCNLVHPAVMGVTDESFAVIDCDEYQIAQYKFTLNGTPFTFRFANIEEDISGVYIDGALAFETTSEMNIATEEYKLARWFTMDGQYCLCAEDHNELDADAFNDFADELMDQTSIIDWSGVYEEIAGDYQDRTSGRATMTITNAGDHVDIEVLWANSAFETVRWLMTGTAETDGTLNYYDCQEGTLTYAADGSEEYVGDYIEGSGYFQYNADEKTFYWDGAEDENCKDCAFEKMQ